MKTFIAILCASISFSTLAAIVAPQPTAAMRAALVTKTITMQDDDPQALVKLSAIETQAVQAHVIQRDKIIAQKWQARIAAAKAKAQINPLLVK
ncbi:MAG: hypothetical protein HOP02_08445 [Methylococcaceae bacterium]|nr:hypothetical protein [Methylococcaceae bacterium]